MAHSTADLPRRTPAAPHGAVLRGGLRLLVALLAPALIAADRPAPAASRSGEIAVEVAPSPARVSDDLILAVRIECRAGVLPREPSVQLAPEDFRLRQVEPLPRATEGSRAVYRWRYTLEPARTGRLSIGPVSAALVPREPAGAAEETVAAEAIAVEVTSMVAGLPSLGALRAPAGPLALPEAPPRGVSWWWGAIAGVALVVAVGCLWRWRRRRPVAAAPAPASRESARDELQRLLNAGWAAQDSQQFYQELADVVRRHLARTTGVRAMELTTRECLGELAARRPLSAGATANLKTLLESADLVKFAACRPEPDAIQESIRQARALLDLRLAEAEG